MKITRIILTSIYLFLALQVLAQGVSPSKYEYRAVWLTTIENLDWPKTVVRRNGDIARQQAELVSILDSLQAMNVNTVLLQTRVRGDVIYPSAIEPFSPVLTGVPGKSPGYDPLAFAIEECHKRGMQLHAWLVTLPLGKDEHIVKQGSLALSRHRRSLCTHYRGAWYMEPGNPEVASYITSLVEEVVKNYDIDGVHLDYVRYPDRTNGYPDTQLHRKHGRGLSLADWRRNNITNIARAVYTTVKELKPWVRVSCAPLGKFDDLTRYRSLGWNAYDAVFQDAQAWMRDGIMDIIFPMLYFDGNNFYPFVLDWQENSYGRHVVPGIGIYRLFPEYGGWPVLEIERQLNTSRSAGTAGTAMFRAHHMLSNVAGGYDAYRKVYRTPALVPPMYWAGDAPLQPQNVVAVRDKEGVDLSWDVVPSADGFPAVRYNVYAAIGDSVDCSNALHLVSVMSPEQAFRWNCSTYASLSLAVTAVNAYGIECEPVMVCCAGVESRISDSELSLTVAGARTMQVTDVYGREIYRGRYSDRIIVGGLGRGHYILNLFDASGALVGTKEFAR